MPRPTSQDEFDRFHDNLVQGGVAGAFEKAYNDKRDALLRGTWQAITTLAATSFGKGVLLAGAAVIGISLLAPVIGLATGAITSVSFTLASGNAITGVGAALMTGLSIAGSVLTSTLGLVGIGAVGAYSAVRAVSKEKAEVAKLTQDADARILRKQLDELGKGQARAQEPVLQAPLQAPEQAASTAITHNVQAQAAMPAEAQSNFAERCCSTKKKHESYLAAEEERRMIRAAQTSLGATV